MVDFTTIPNEVHAAVAAVCPIFGVSFGDLADKTTWTVQFKPEATDEEKAAAQVAIDGYNIVTPSGGAA
jgi:hypothetical protein